jgi:FkbM family methyltransferase
MKKVYLDLGTHYGEGLREFIEMYKIDDSWEIHTFEANPNTYMKFLGDYLKLTPKVIAHNKAVYTNNGKHIFNFETYEPHNENNTGMGSSLFDVVPYVFGQSFTSGEVDCIDISEFVKNNFSEDDFILIKMDIEGAEYHVLDKMLKDGTVKYINDLYIEWHFIGFHNSAEELSVLYDDLKSRILPQVDKLEDWK